MELMQLRYFSAVAETRSFTAAARRLHVSQPALSYQVKQLEHELGARLFDRTSRRVTLSADGRIFLPLAQAVLFKADEAVRVMEERLGAETGEVDFGSIPSVSAHVVPHILGSFSRQFPGVKVNLMEAGTVDLERALLEGQLDVAIVSEPTNPTVFEVKPLVEEDLVLLVSIDHPFAQRGRVSLREMADEDFIMPDATYALADQIVDACRHAGFAPSVAYRTSLESLRSFVAHQLGVALFPRLGLEGPEEPRIIALQLEENVTRVLNLIRRKDRYATVATRALMVHARSVLHSPPFSRIGRPVADPSEVPAERRAPLRADLA